MKRPLFLFCTALVAGGCQRSSESDSSSTGPETRSGTSTSKLSTTTLSNRPAENRPAENPPADAPPLLNVPASVPDEPTADTMNERDRSGASATSDDQGSGEADRRITQEVHQAILDDASLGATAKDVKITTKDGVVTLRGPVKSRQEKAQIAAVAQRVSGILSIDNRLDIATP